MTLLRWFDIVCFLMLVLFAMIGAIGVFSVILDVWRGRRR